MGADEIEAAHVPFAQTLRAGGFREPADTWSAGQIAAHICLNNEMISDAAERLHAGEQVSYDNADGVEDGELAAFAARLGGLGQLADEVTRSAARLARAYDTLSPAQRSTQVHVVIRDNGQVVRDAPLPIGALLTGNADFHLALHHEQLRELQDQPGS